MSERYEKFNELTFVPYCFTAIDRGIKREIFEKESRSNFEISLSDLEGAEELLNIYL